MKVMCMLKHNATSSSIVPVIWTRAASHSTSVSLEVAPTTSLYG
jgi:hypothetical protein